jgi:hypothetical protein
LIPGALEVDQQQKSERKMLLEEIELRGALIMPNKKKHPMNPMVAKCLMGRFDKFVHSYHLNGCKAINKKFVYHKIKRKLH